MGCTSHVLQKQQSKGECMGKKVALEVRNICLSSSFVYIFAFSSAIAVAKVALLIFFAFSSAIAVAKVALLIFFAFSSAIAVAQVINYVNIVWRWIYNEQCNKKWKTLLDRFVREQGRRNYPEGEIRAHPFNLPGHYSIPSDLLQTLSDIDREFC